MSQNATQKETVEFDAKFLDQWNTFCDSHGLKKRLAAHASRVAFMQMSVTEREKIMGEAVGYVVASRTRRRKKK